MGNVAFEMYTEHAPKTCKNFKELARKGYYSGERKRARWAGLASCIEAEQPQCAAN